MTSCEIETGCIREVFPGNPLLFPYFGAETITFLFLKAPVNPWRKRCFQDVVGYLM